MFKKSLCNEKSFEIVQRSHLIKQWHNPANKLCAVYVSWSAIVLQKRKISTISNNGKVDAHTGTIAFIQSKWEKIKEKQMKSWYP